MSLPIQQMIDDAEEHGATQYTLCRQVAEHVKALAAEVERLQRELDHLDRKAQHGCTDAGCAECDR